MKINKHTIIITVEVLDPLAAMAQINQAAALIHDEHPSGELNTFDGDGVKWETIITPKTV